MTVRRPTSGGSWPYPDQWKIPAADSEIPANSLNSRSSLSP